MARSFAKIFMSLWHSKKFRTLRGKDRPRLMYFFLHTCPQANSVGCFHAPIGYMVADLGWGENQVAEALQTLREAILIGWDESEEIVRIVDYLDHDPPTNPNHAFAMEQVIRSLPDCREKLAVLNDLLKSEHAVKLADAKTLYDTLRQAFQEGIETPFTSSLLPSTRPSSLRSEGSARGGAPRQKMPEDWPSEKDRANAVAYWHEHGRGDLEPLLEQEITKARAHHLGKGTRSPDWSQVWVTWYARAISYNRQAPQARPTATIIKVA